MEQGVHETTLQTTTLTRWRECALSLPSTGYRRSSRIVCKPRQKVNLPQCSAPQTPDSDQDIARERYPYDAKLEFAVIPSQVRIQDNQPALPKRVHSRGHH